MSLFLLGVDDPEMRRMAGLLRETGQQAVIATKNGVPVQPGNAYHADSMILPEGCDTLVCIECRPEVIPDGIHVVVIDHHRPGDPGYDLPPEQYWQAASLGQLATLLGVEPTHEDLVLAAMDHAFGAAVRGECPGVPPEEVLALKRSDILLKAQLLPEQLDAMVAVCRHQLRQAPVVWISSQKVRDLRGRYLGEGYSVDLLVMQMVVALEGCVALLRHSDLGDPVEKITLTGHSRPETFQEFKDSWGPGQGLKRIYGVPVRGYAGGYIE